MEYLIDRKIVGLFLGKDEFDPAVIDYLTKYQQKIAGITDKIVFEYLKNDQRLTNDQIKQELENLVNNNIREDSHLLDNFLNLEISQKVTLFNKSIYDYYREKLSEEDKTKVNAYIASVQDQINKDFEEDKTVFEEVLAEVLNEYKATGTVKAWEEVSQSASNVDEASVQQVQPDVSTQSVRVQLTQKPNVDPVLGF